MTFFTEPSVLREAMLDSQPYNLNLGGEISMFISKMMFKLPKKTYDSDQCELSPTDVTYITRNRAHYAYSPF